MRYLSTLSLALIAHVLLSIVVLMALACTAEPADSGPRYSEEEAIAVLKEHLQTKVIPGFTHPVMPGTVVVVPQQLFGQSTPCLSAIEDKSVTWSAKYNNEAHRWDVHLVSPRPTAGLDSMKEKEHVRMPDMTGQSEQRLATRPIPTASNSSINQNNIGGKWSVYERTKAIVATGDHPFNQFC